jgi:hypothetical protein
MTNPACYTCFALPFNLPLGIITAQAQSTSILNKLSQSTNSATTKLVPQKAEAAESAFYIMLYGLYGLVTPVLN